MTVNRCLILILPESEYQLSAQACICPTQRRPHLCIKTWNCPVIIDAKQNVILYLKKYSIRTTKFNEKYIFYTFSEEMCSNIRTYYGIKMSNTIVRRHRSYFRNKKVDQLKAELYVLQIQMNVYIAQLIHYSKLKRLFTCFFLEPRNPLLAVGHLNTSHFPNCTMGN